MQDTKTFTYDFLDRLATADGPYSQTWEYDVLGNITDFDGTAYTYGTKPHAVTSVGSYTQSYDANGNMTGRENATGTQTLTFDVENRLSQVQGTGGGYSGTATYVYDGDGNRIKKTEGGSTVVYPNRYYEKNVTSGVITSHYYLGGQQIAIKKGSTLEYLHQDSLNSSSVSTANDGSQVSKTVFLPFGATRSSTGTLGTDQLYTGQRLDGTGLYFYNARYYDASIGRFISPDNYVQLDEGQPTSSVFLNVNLASLPGAPDLTTGGLSLPQALDRYSYVLNNPLTNADPTGWWTLSISIHISWTFKFIHVDYGVGLVADDKGNSALFKVGGTGGGAGAGASVSVGVAGTSAQTIHDLEGTPSINSGGTVIDVEGATGEVIAGHNSDGTPYVGFGVSYGVGGEDAIYSYPSIQENWWEW